MATGQYFQALDRWTPFRDEAYDFGVVGRAMKFAHKARIPGLELVLSFESPEQAASLLLGKLLPSQPKAKHA